MKNFIEKMTNLTGLIPLDYYGVWKIADHTLIYVKINFNVIRLFENITNFI